MAPCPRSATSGRSRWRPCPCSWGGGSSPRPAAEGWPGPHRCSSSAPSTGWSRTSSCCPPRGSTRPSRDWPGVTCATGACSTCRTSNLTRPGSLLPRLFLVGELLEVVADQAREVGAVDRRVLCPPAADHEADAPLGHREVGAEVEGIPRGVHVPGVIHRPRVAAVPGDTDGGDDCICPVRDTGEGRGIGDVPAARETGRKMHSGAPVRSEEHTSELQSRGHLVCRLLLEKKKH